MKQIAEKYPKVWRQFQTLVNYSTGYDVPWHDFNALFGYLVLEFFPKHGIEIERIILNDEWETGYRICYKIDGEKKYSLTKTPENAISRAFEILESQEE